MSSPGWQPEKDLARARTFPSRWYTDPAILRAERDAIFARTWQPVGRTSQLAETGDFFTAEVEGEPIVLTRDPAGAIHAFYNVCRHRAGAVASGCGRRRSLQCQYHGWTYGLDGRLLHAPETEGVEAFDAGELGLKPIAVDTWGGFVFVNLAGGASAPSLGAVLGAIPEEARAFGLDGFVTVARRDYVIGCNWKVYVDNYLEGYHVPIAHPGLFKELDYARYRVETFENYSRQYAPIRPAKAGDAGRRYSPSADGDETEALYYWVFPNWMLNIYPDNMSLNIVVPLAIDRTLTIFEWYFPDPDGPGVREQIERTIAFSDEIQREDITLCETVQARLGSRAYEPGRFSVLRENGVHHFQQLVYEALRGLV